MSETGAFRQEGISISCVVVVAFKNREILMQAQGNINNSEGEQGGDAVVQVSRPQLKEPPRFAVVLYNDDYTTMEFVIEVLKRFFHKSEEQSVQIMLQVHQNGKGTAGIYSFEIAETKAMQVGEFSRVQGHPLQCSVEPAP
jgi:ATP-dependent Clp protease adaptor protein ClpS